MRKIIAIDFDGVLCADRYPEIGPPNYRVIKQALAEQKKGSALILWTCRDGELLDKAVEWCEECGIYFAAINENLPEMIERYGMNPRKVGADEYWDDKAVLKKRPESEEVVPSDSVNHPEHYTFGGIECIDALEAATTGLSGAECGLTWNILKYMWRWKLKNGIEDLKKAMWYLTRLIEKVEESVW